MDLEVNNKDIYFLGPRKKNLHDSSLSVSAEEFGHLLDENVGSNFDNIGVNAMANKDQANSLTLCQYDKCWGNKFLNCHARNCLLQLKLHHLVKPFPAICSAPKLLQRLTGAAKTAKSHTYDRIRWHEILAHFYSLSNASFRGLCSSDLCALYRVSGLQRQSFASVDDCSPKFIQTNLIICACKRILSLALGPVTFEETQDSSFEGFNNIGP
ncbi:CCAAT/enhancer-binding protein zeta [Fukomys damarensis]|uniref:CCAAT/enhancer-binding protein zeta n=1 Tax=Fukomys damarensis TaxID=885580 RepID=A0A091D1C1_FUKDA|nr:CCAAT/enhancer-binding protein zeta [Fukomys damarensis]